MAKLMPMIVAVRAATTPLLRLANKGIYARVTEISGSEVVRPHPHLDPATASMIEIIEQRFGLMFSDFSAFRDLIAKGLEFKSADYASEKLALIEPLSVFSEELFEALVCGGASYKTGPINFLWQRLAAHRVVIHVVGSMTGAFADHMLDKQVLLEHLLGDTFANLFAPPSALANRYAEAILSIDVEKDGVPRRGSGFVARARFMGRAQIVTCRHNIDPAEGIALKVITTAAGRAVRAGAPIMSDRFDLCVLPLIDEAPLPSFRLNGTVGMFDEVYSLGYPNLPGAKPVLMGHRGEVNAVAELYLQKSPAIIISNMVAPGSSGGPVLVGDGRCVGMVMSWLEGEVEGGEKTRFSAALPAMVIAEEMEVLSGAVTAENEKPQ